MRDLPRNFDYDYKVFLRHGSWYHLWLIHGPRGTIHFHFSHNEEHLEKYGTCAGLEIHYRTPPDYMKHKAPNQPRCDILNAPCWHDGTSTYATESLYPMVDLTHPLEMFKHLVGEMKRFEDDSESAS